MKICPLRAELFHADRWTDRKDEVNGRLFSLLHRAYCQVIRLLHQLLHIYKIYKIYTLKH